MSSNFDWKTDEDFDWDKLAEDPPRKQPPHKRKPWLPVLAIVLLIGGLGAYLYSQVAQRIDENTEAMRSDIISSHNLIHLAEEEQDTELFFSLLSGRDSSWTAAQHTLFQSHSLRNRTPFGLHFQPGEQPAPDEDTAPTVTFSPDLLIADVETLLPYEIKIGNGLTETITLQETVQYRLGRERWLLSPPDEPFWGAPLLSESTRIALDYRQRDEEIAMRLLADLERKLVELCGQLDDIACGPDLQLNITLSTDPQTLVDAAMPHAGLLTNKGLRVNLPSPTLVGLPQDEAGYQALFRGYAAQMATAVISQQTGYECCKQMPFQQALLDYQLSQIALKPWPISGEEYGQVLDEQIRLEDYAPLWRSEDPQDLYGPDGWRVYVLVDYLLSNLPHNSAVEIQRELVRRGSFTGWLNGLFEEESEHKNAALMSELTRGFWKRGYTQVLNDPTVAMPPPAQNLHLACSTVSTGGNGGQVSTLFQFDFEENEWGNLYEMPGDLWVASLPGDDLLLQQEYNGEIQQWASNLRRNDQPLMPLSGGDDLTVSFGQADPLTTGLTTYVFGADSDEATITWFDLQNCTETEGCPGRELPGIPIWSPDGERALFTSDPGSQFDLLFKQLQTILLNRGATNITTPLHIGDRSQFLEGEPLTEADELPTLASGHAPFWIDDNTIGYVTGDGDPIIQHSSRVMVMSVDQNDPQLLFTLRDMVEEIEGGLSAFRLYWIHYVMVHPDNPDQLFVVVMSTYDRRAHVLSFDRKTSEVRYLMSAGFRANHSLGISPDGHYLVLTGVDEDDPDPGALSTLLQVYDLEREQTIPFLTLTTNFPPFSPYDWSVDGQWLAMMIDEGTVGLFAPQHKQLELLRTPPGNCGTPAWMNR